MKKVRLILYIIIIGFLLNLIWENAQAPLYEGYESFWQHFMICFWASLVDVAVILLIYGLFAIWYKDFFWITYMNWKIGTLLITAGGIIAVGFEYWAFESGTWAYTENMPIVPVLMTGLSPLLQMMLLPLLTFWLSYKLVIKRETDGRSAAL
jgi:hypothetical protein